MGGELSFAVPNVKRKEKGGQHMFWQSAQPARAVDTSARHEKEKKRSAKTTD